MKRIVVVILAIVFCSAMAAQTGIFSAFRSKPAADFKLDTRNSFISLQNARIFGIKGGLDFSNTIRAGVGYNTLFSGPQAQVATGGNEEVRAKVYFNYMCAYVEWVFHSTDKWEASVPFQLGTGSSGYKFKQDGIRHKVGSGTHWLAEPAIAAHYKVLPWAGLGVGMGYRMMLRNNPQLDEDFSSPIYVLKMKIFLNDVSIPGSLKNKKAP